MIIGRKRLGTILLAVGALAALGIDVLVVEPNRLKIRRIALHYADLPVEADGLVIAHISDLHLHKIGPRERKVLRLIEENPPDVIAITGDLVSNRRDREECFEFLKGLKAKSGIWAVQGNWEYYTAWTGRILRDDLGKFGIKLLINEAEHLTIYGNLWIAGTDDPYLGCDDVSQTLAGTEGGFVVLLAHSPEIMNRAPDTIRLILSGHTHGGQVWIPFIGAPWGRRMGGGYLSGIYRRNETVMYVTKGVGMTHLPVRFLCPPEIAYITLQRK